MNDEFLRRLQRAGATPQDIIDACNELGGVSDRLDFAVKILKRAGFKVSI